MRNKKIYPSIIIKYPLLSRALIKKKQGEWVNFHGKAHFLELVTFSLSLPALIINISKTQQEKLGIWVHFEGKQLCYFQFCLLSQQSSEEMNFPLGINHGGESLDLNDRVHRISCRYSDKTKLITLFLIPNRFS